MDLVNMKSITRHSILEYGQELSWIFIQAADTNSGSNTPRAALLALSLCTICISS